jgi:hypothetical protein
MASGLPAGVPALSLSASLMLSYAAKDSGAYGLAGGNLLELLPSWKARMELPAAPLGGCCAVVRVLLQDGQARVILRAVSYLPGALNQLAAPDLLPAA